jgi:hypothetical protein
LYITFCVSGNSDVRYWLDTILTVHVCININGRIDSIQCTDSVSNCSMINCIHLCAENKEICHIFNAWLIYKVILFIKDIYSTEEREGMRGYWPDINKYSTETRGDLNSNLDVFSMQTFLRGLSYVRWAIQAHLSL